MLMSKFKGYLLFLFRGGVGSSRIVTGILGKIDKGFLRADNIEERHVYLDGYFQNQVRNSLASILSTPNDGSSLRWST
jgi:hypothetical protein